MTFAADGLAVAVSVNPRQGRDQAGAVDGPVRATPERADRNTRGYFYCRGNRHWLDVFPDISGQPASVR